MKRIKLILIIIFLCSCTINNKDKANFENIDPKLDFLLGKWEVTTDIEYTVEFINKNELFYCVKYLHDGNLGCDKYTYTEIAENDYLVENVRSKRGHWYFEDIGNADGTLTICLWSKEKCLIFNKIFP